MTDQTGFDNIAWQIMMRNSQTNELDRIIAINDCLSGDWWDELPAGEHQNIVDRIAIGIYAYNMANRAEVEKTDWRRLPDFEVSGNEQS